MRLRVRPSPHRTPAEPEELECSNSAIPMTAPAVRNSNIPIMMIMGLQAARQRGWRCGDRLLTGDVRRLRIQREHRCSRVTVCRYARSGRILTDRARQSRLRQDRARRASAHAAVVVVPWCPDRQKTNGGPIRWGHHGRDRRSRSDAPVRGRSAHCLTPET